MHQTRLKRCLLYSSLLGLIVPGAGILSCRQHVALLPLGTNNNTRLVDAPASPPWAQPLDRPGLPNLHKVSDDLYRGAQPAAEGIEQLETLGIKTIVNLRTSDTDRGLLREGSPTCERIPMTAWRPKDADVVRFLEIATDESRRPVFVHCRRGADRTGMMVAVYRIVVQGWDKEQAIAEMTQGGFRFNSGWQNLVQYLRDLDIDAIRQRAGLGGPISTN